MKNINILYLRMAVFEYRERAKKASWSLKMILNQAAILASGGTREKLWREKVDATIVEGGKG